MGGDGEGCKPPDLSSPHLLRFFATLYDILSRGDEAPGPNRAWGGDHRPFPESRAVLWRESD